jgi:hypothetical protein
MVLPSDGNYHPTMILLFLNTHSVKTISSFNIDITTFGFPKHKAMNMDGIPNMLLSSLIDSNVSLK